jgi:L-seryl-tRNA(Ser) seleniumtransferase
MLTMQPEALKAKALSWLRRLRPRIPHVVTLRVVAGSSQAGGGSLPLLELPSFLLAVEAPGWTPQGIDAAFRACKTHVLGRVSKGQYLLDLRTLQDADLPALADALRVLGNAP